MPPRLNDRSVTGTLGAGGWEEREGEQQFRREQRARAGKGENDRGLHSVIVFFLLLSSNPEFNRLIRESKEKNLSLRELAFIVHIWVLIFLDLD